MTNSSDLLAPQDLALLIDGTGSVPERLAEPLAAILRSDPRFAEPVAELEALARAAGLAPQRCYLSRALEAHRDADRLLATTGWQHPAEVLDPEGDRGVDYGPLMHLVAERAKQAGDPTALRSVHERLTRACGVERADDALVETFLEGLLSREPELAESLLNRARSRYRRSRRGGSVSEPIGAACPA